MGKNVYKKITVSSQLRHLAAIVEVPAIWSVCTSPDSPEELRVWTSFRYASIHAIKNQWSEEAAKSSFSL